MRVVLDTNVIVAAFATRGLCADVFAVCLENHCIIISEPILSEIAKNLIKKIRLPKNIAHNIIGYLREVSEVVKPEKVDDSVCRDKHDLKIIGTALKGKAALILTGDEDLLILKRFKKIEIITPREFWSRLKK
ncbi:MAG: putative toxin-antitoxin system toxin component, PIN family [Thermodesulfovibrionia bacterium]|nr:putative toxin-antitoxin system toxin component, PIN family [Thermodesulfovibrionia bacterium]